MIYVWLLIGFLLLIKGADVFVDGASSLARLLRVPSVIIGLTIVSMGTSAPEAAVSITAGLVGNSDISLANIVGSNLFNLLVVISVCACLAPIRSDPDILKRDMCWNITVTLLLLLLIVDGGLSRIDGVLLLLGMGLYLFIILRHARDSRTEPQQEKCSVWRAVGCMVIGLAGVVLGGQMVVQNASAVAAAWGMSDALIGLTIVAIGTSLPELVTSVAAARKGDSGIAVGNAIGSCLFNILFILGATAVLSPIAAAAELVTDTVLLLAAAVLLFAVAKSGRITTRAEGAMCMLCYAAYSVYLILRLSGK